MRTLFVLAIMIPGIGAALTNRFAALLLYLWFGLFRPQEWLWTDISALRPSLALGLLLAVPCLLTGVWPYLAHPISLGALAFLGSALLGQTGAIRPEIGWNWIDYLFRLLIVALLAISLVSDSKRFRWTLAVIAGSFGFHSAKAGLDSLMSGGLRYSEGFAGAFGDNNGYAVGMAMIIPLLIGVGQNVDHRWLRRVFLLMAPLTVIAVVATFSRGGFLAVGAGVLMMAALHRRRVLAFGALAVMAVPLALFMMSQSGYVDRLQTIRTYEREDERSALGRLHYWRVAIDMVMARPLGVGLFNYEQAYDEFDKSDGEFGRHRSVHSSHLQVLAETGFLGAAVYCGLFIYAYRCAWRIRKRAMQRELEASDRRLFETGANALLASMTAFLVGGAFIAMALNDLTWLTFALVAALDLISARACALANSSVGVRQSASAALPVPVHMTWRPTA